VIIISILFLYSFRS